MSWSAVKLGDICTIEKGQTGIQKAIPGPYPLVVTGEERKSHNEFQFDDEAVIIPLVSGTGHGHASIKRIHYQTGKFALGSILCAVIPKDKTTLNPEYLFRFLELNKETELVARMRGMANVTLPIKEIAKIEIPLPPLKEQIAFVNDYKILVEKNSLLLEQFNNQMNLIKQLRQSFLSEAMQGKLVNSKYIEGQDTGQQLLEKIKTEKGKLIKEKKIKKSKELPPISEQEIPFTIPKHWSWCRIGEVALDVSYGTSQKADDFSEIPVLRMGNITTDGTILYSNLKFVSPAIKDLPKLYLKNNDLVFNRTNSYELVGKCAVFNNTEPFTLASYLIRLRLSDQTNSRFLSHYINSSFCRQTQIEPYIIQQNGQANFNGTKLSNIIIPVPPFREQQQIVEKLEELIAFCNNLEKNIKESQYYIDMLLRQVLREAIEPKEETKVLPLQSRKIENPLKTIIAGHIINLNNTKDFGRVKFQKLLYLTEHLCKIDFDSHYIKKVAGPYDDELIRSIETDLVRMRFFNVIQERSEYKRVHYTALSGAKEIETLFLENFSKENSAINNLLLKLRPLNMSECEVVATLYAVWNNRIINNEPVSDQDLYDDFMAWSDQKVKYRSVVYKWLFWMKEQEIIPDGWGKYVDKPQKLNLFDA